MIGLVLRIALRGERDRIDETSEPIVSWKDSFPLPKGSFSLPRGV